MNDMKKRQSTLIVITLNFLAALFPSLCHSDEKRWVGSWYAAPVEFAPQFSNSTLRTVVHLTSGGNRLRLRLSNVYGQTPLKIGAAHVAVGNIGKQVKFGDKMETVLMPGTTAVSDPVDLVTTAGTEIVVSVYYPEPIPQKISMHFGAGDGNTLIPGNATQDVSTSEASGSPTLAMYFLTGVDVENSSSHGTIVALGDSITDGGTDHWPALLAQRLSHDGKAYGILNAGISGNRLLSGIDGTAEIYGQSALIRFDREVLDKPSVRYVIVYEGINDLGLGETTKSDGSNPPTVDAVVSALRRLAQRAHKHNVKLYVATITPFETESQSTYYSPQKDVIRQKVNEWIRSSHEIDSYFDFDKALADPAHPKRLKLGFDSGDHLHPNAAGEQALSEAVDLSKFN